MKTAMTTLKGYRNHGSNRINVRPSERLAFFRDYGIFTAGRNWRDARATMHAPESSVLSPGWNSKDYGVRSERYPIMHAWADSVFRGEQWADECEEAGRTVEHKGWYTDEDCTRTLRPFVFRLTHGRWGCGYADTDSGSRVYLLEVHHDARSAAASADHEAQYYAAQEQEYNERWNAAQALRNAIISDKHEVAKEFALRHHKRLGESARERCADMIAEVREKQRKLANDYSDIEE